MSLAPAALSLHREDGTVPHLVAASPPDFSRDRSEGAQGEKTSTPRAQRSGVDSELTSPTSGIAHSGFHGLN